MYFINYQLLSKNSSTFRIFQDDMIDMKMSMGIFVWSPHGFNRIRVKSDEHSEALVCVYLFAPVPHVGECTGVQINKWYWK